MSLTKGNRSIAKNNKTSRAWRLQSETFHSTTNRFEAKNFENVRKTHGIRTSRKVRCGDANVRISGCDVTVGKVDKSWANS
jgi:hypothetical protein